MNKLFKGAVAGAAGVALLLGGAGTFALWQDATSFGVDQAINSGNLRFDEVGEGTWALNGNAIDGTGLASLLIVPGDVLTYTVDDVTVIAHGNNLEAQLGITMDDATGDAELLEALDPVLTVDGVAPGIVAIPNEGTTTVGTVMVTMTFDAENIDAQDMTVNLGDIQLTLEQTRSGYDVDNAV